MVAGVVFWKSDHAISFLKSFQCWIVINVSVNMSSRKRPYRTDLCRHRCHPDLLLHTSLCSQHKDVLSVPRVTARHVSSFANFCTYAAPSSSKALLSSCQLTPTAHSSRPRGDILPVACLLFIRLVITCPTRWRLSEGVSHLAMYCLRIWLVPCLIIKFQ